MFRFIGNIIWIILAGIETAIMFVMLGIGWCITIVGIPFGFQCFKLAGLALWPFGRLTEHRKGFFAKHPIANLIWFVLGGFMIFIYYILLGVILCITIIGIPFGKQCFKLAKLTLAPFGAAVKSMKHA